ncbi:MAG: metal-dependent hydrolase [Candidatus Aureabacteria bacterium]|nr:metal-dependent hydrolase [Candidatus Auribacterota bacterium]
MKGLTHFLSGVSLASFIPAACKLANSEVSSSYILVLGGLYGIMPDTLDFKIGQFISRVDHDVDADPNNPNPQKMAEQIGRAMEEAYETGRYIKVQLYPLRLGVDLWRQYVLKFDSANNEIVVVINEIVTTSQIAYLGTEPKSNRVGRYRIKCKMIETHGKPSVVDIMSGPQFGFKRIGDRVEVGFLPWHRTWSHSFVLGFMLSIPVWLIASWLTGWGMGWLYGLVAFLGFAIHITEDLTGHMGGSLLWPFQKDRTNGLCLFKASNPHANFAVDYLAVTLLLYNLSRFAPQPAIKLGPLGYALYVLVIPLTVYFAIVKLFGEKGEEKKGGEISAEKALAREEDTKVEELMYEAADTVTGDLQ